MSLWSDTLLPATFRGVPFYVDSSESRFGRNTAEHPYPFRDRNPVWIEDLGVAPNTHRISGFIVGDLVGLQLQALKLVFQLPGQGILTHPTLGILTGSAVGGLQTMVRKDRGRVIELSFAFVENDPNDPYPDSGSSTQQGVQTAGTNAQGAAATDYNRNAPGPPTASVAARDGRRDQG